MMFYVALDLMLLAALAWLLIVGMPRLWIWGCPQQCVCAFCCGRRGARIGAAAGTAGADEGLGSQLYGEEAAVRKPAVIVEGQVVDGQLAFDGKVAQGQLDTVV